MTRAGRSGVLRAALNLNNTALVQKTGETYAGIAADIARRIAAVTGLKLQVTDCSSARAVVSGRNRDDPARPGAA